MTARKPQRHAETASEFDREARVLAGQIHRKSNVIAAVQDDLALGLVDEAVARARGDGLERRAQIDTRLGAQHQCLAGGDQMNEREHIGHHFGDRRLLDATQMDDLAAHRLQRRLDAISNTCCAPPTSTVMSPASARWTPPVTGQARVATPGCRARARQGFDLGEIVGAHLDPGAARAHGR